MSYKEKTKKTIPWIILVLGLTVAFLHLEGVKFCYDNQEATSLPWHKYLVLPLKWPFEHKVKLGDYIAFKTDRRVLPYFKPGTVFAKRVVGMPGDKLEVKGRDFYINGRFVGRARKTDKLGNPAPLFVYNGTIPQNAYFVMGHHPRSFDSRYWGFVYKRQIIGKVLPFGKRAY